MGVAFIHVEQKDHFWRRAVEKISPHRQAEAVPYMFQHYCRQKLECEWVQWSLMSTENHRKLLRLNSRLKTYKYSVTAFILKNSVCVCVYIYIYRDFIHFMKLSSWAGALVPAGSRPTGQLLHWSIRPTLKPNQKKTHYHNEVFLYISKKPAFSEDLHSQYAITSSLLFFFNFSVC